MALAGMAVLLLAGCGGGLVSPAGTSTREEDDAEERGFTKDVDTAGSSPRADAGEPADPAKQADGVSELAEPAAPLPAPPPAMAESSDRGAVAAAGHYVSLMSYAFVTGDIEPMAEMTGADCKACTEIMGNIEALHAQGGRVIWSSLSLEHVTVETVANGAYVLTFNRHSQAALFMPADRSGTPLPIVYQDEVLRLQRQEGVWQVREYQIGESI